MIFRRRERVVIYSLASCPFCCVFPLRKSEDWKKDEISSRRPLSGSPDVKESTGLFLYLYILIYYGEIRMANGRKGDVRMFSQ